MRGSRIVLLGASGTIGRATEAALRARGAAVVSLTRAEIADAPALAQRLAEEGCRAIVSCMASRTGAPRDAWAVDFEAHRDVLAAAKTAGVPRFVQLSAICVQKPLLAFQRAKLAFEQELMGSDLAWTIIRPTAFFKSLSGQIARVQAGKPFLVFGNGELTACKPISDGDLAAYIAETVDDMARFNRILPIGGPGPAITPREQGEALFALLGRKPQFRQVPVAMLDAIIAGLSLAGRLSQRLADRAEFARIGRYYATESMLVWDAAMGRYSAEATPETGADTLFQHYADVLAGRAHHERTDHAVF